MAVGHFKRSNANCRLGIGTGDVSYLPGTTLPMYDFRGPGVVPTFVWHIVQGPQIWQGLNVTADGLRGVLSGQFIMQPLKDERGVYG